METKNIIKKLAELLHKDKDVYNGNICFDFGSYEFEEDIPHINILGKRELVQNIYFSKDGKTIIITNEGSKELTLNVDSFTEENFEDMDMYELLNTAYYETTYSYEIGDFEINFLNI